MVYYNIVLGFLIGAIAVPATMACSGYRVKTNMLKTCDGVDSIIKFDEFSTQLNKKCRAVPTGCLETSKSFTSANVTYKIVKDLLKFEGTKDGCKSMGEAPDEAVVIMQLMGLPTSCPVEKSKVCGEQGKEVDITKYKQYLPAAAGKYKGEVKINHDTGTSCIKFDMEIKGGILG